MRVTTKRGCVRTASAHEPESAWPGRAERGSQLFEFALVLPLLCVILVGITDFAQAYVLRQKVTNAAREGTRIAVQYSRIDNDNPAPNSIRVIRNSIVRYLQEADLDVSTFDANPTKTLGNDEFTYYDGNGNAVIVIRRGILITPTGGGPNILATRVTVRYPFAWTFSNVIRLLVPSASYSSSFLISNDALMKDLVT